MRQGGGLANQRRARGHQPISTRGGSCLANQHMGTHPHNWPISTRGGVGGWPSQYGGHLTNQHGWGEPDQSAHWGMRGVPTWPISMQLGVSAHLTNNLCKRQLANQHVRRVPMWPTNRRKGLQANQHREGHAYLANQHPWTSGHLANQRKELSSLPGQSACAKSQLSSQSAHRESCLPGQSALTVSCTSAQ